MSRYSAFGLDTKKKSKEKGNLGKAFCPWCQRNLDVGFSMCFSNWVICLECSQEGLKHFEEPDKSNRIMMENCFKNFSKEERLCFMSIGEGLSIGISKEELKAAFFYLKNRIFVGKNGQTYLNL